LIVAKWEPQHERRDRQLHQTQEDDHHPQRHTASDATTATRECLRSAFVAPRGDGTIR
jgi:hypothetical protein